MKVIKLNESDLQRIVKRVLTEQETKKMSFMGATPMIKNDWDSGNGFFAITYEKNGIVNSVKNFWDGGSAESQRNSFSGAEKIGISGNGGSLDNSISFGYVTTVKAGNKLNLTFNASSNSGNVSSQTYSFRSPKSLDKDTIYHGEFILINLPQNSDITITAKGDSENKLVVKTLETVNCDKEWVIIEKALEEALLKNKSIDIKPYICKEDQTEFIKNQISDIDDRKINCLLSKVKSWCK
tara:strand:+ start:1722 stop:2438 length:717 start_codon:yes stop_codon:yes gene_type:complete